MSEVSVRVLPWFDINGRKDLPWQCDPTPYRVWISEIMLQQTQVTTVIPYFTRFMESFPDIASLANAHVDEILLHWAGLGYYARARNLHKTAVILRDQYAGAFPAAIDQVMALPGIGRSTAGAILALSMNQHHPILDGNVKRVLARYHEVDGWPGDTKVAAMLWKHAEVHTPTARVAEYTQAMMDLGATVCMRGRPSCSRCPLNENCMAHRHGTEAQFPNRKPARVRPLRQTRMLLAHYGGALFLEKRPNAGIWGGLWSLPEVQDGMEIADWCSQYLAAEPATTNEWPLLRHSFSHYDLDIRPVVVQLRNASSKVAEPAAGRWVSLNESSQIGLATPVRKLVDTLQEAGW